MSRSTQNEMSTKELIVLASPPQNDRYYADMRAAIFDFHIAYAKDIRRYDDVIIFAAPDTYDDYVAALGSDYVAPIEMQDIWMRDFSPLNASSPVMMRYSAAGQGGGRAGQSEADFVQDALAALMNRAGMARAESDWINDGGNFVEDGAGRAVISRKFLRDNGLSETAGRAAIREATGVNAVAFIDSDEQGGLEHADGVVAFIDPNTLVINRYPDDEPDNRAYATQLKADLMRALPGITIHEIITPYDGSDIYDSRFGSACGLYTNMLVTPERIYFPQFGIPEDAEALADIKRWTDKAVVPVMSQNVCSMGGDVRCMSWQLRGQPAQTLREYVRKDKDKAPQ